MMVAMMLPSLAPMLAGVGGTPGEQGAAPSERRAMEAAASYFAAWVAIGVAVYLTDAALVALVRRHAWLASSMPLARAAVVLIAGAYQLTPWKARNLACCDHAASHGRYASSPGPAWRHGFGLWRTCARCCGNLMLVLLVTGLMDLHIMAIVTAAITAERLAPARLRLARLNGAAAIGAGLILLVGAIR
jgi:predicted metal-binding membrane protein